MGFDSCSLAATSRIFFGSLPEALATSLISSSECGKNSCKGGSSNSCNASRRPASSSAIIICLTATILSGSKNICSVRHKPIPSAPNSFATITSAGVSALALTFIFLTLSAHSINLAKPPETSGSIVGTLPSITSPLPPSIVIRSPAEKFRPPIDITSSE